jgi:chromosome segregation ATPase
MSRPSPPEDSLREDAIEFHSSDESDLIYQLGDKIRLQARRLASLEQYKLLCERRIQELCPGHPVPVRQEHLGKEGSDGRLLHAALQKVARLEQQVVQSSGSTLRTFSPEDLRQLIGEKAALEESLRAEVFVSEELRAQVEVLKQALEEKMAMFGLPGDLQSVTELLHMQEHYEAFKKDNIELQSALQAAEDDLHSLQSTCSSQQSDLQSLSSQLAHESDRSAQLLSDLEHTKTALSEAETSRKALLEKLESMEASANTQKDIIKALESSHNSLKQDFSGLQEKHQSAYTSLTQTEQETKDLAAQFSRAKEEISRLKETITELERELKEEKGRVAQEQASNRDISAELTREKEEIGRLKGSLEGLRRELAEERESVLQEKGKVKTGAQEKESVERDAAKLRERLEALVQELETERSASKTLQNSLSQTKAELFSAQSQVSSFQSAFHNAKQDLGGREGEISDLKRALQIMTDTNKAASDSSKAREDRLTQQLTALETEKTSLQTALNKQKTAAFEAAELLKASNADFQRRYKELEDLLATTRLDSKTRIEALEKEREDLRRTLEDLQTVSKRHESHKERTEETLRVTAGQLENVEIERRAVKTELETKICALNATKEAFSQLKQAKTSLDAEYESACERLSSLSSSSQSLSSENKLLQAENSELRSRVAALQQDVTELQGLVTEGRKKEKGLEENCAAAEEVIKETTDALQDLIMPFQAVFLSAEEVKPLATLEELLSTLSLMLSAAEARFVEDARAIQGLRAQVREVGEGRNLAEDTVARLENALKTHSSAASEMYLEMQAAKQQLSAERELRHQQYEECQAMDHQLSQAKSELTALRLSLRDYSSEAGALQTQFSGQQAQIERLQGLIQQLEGKLAGVTAEKRRAEGLLGRFVRTVPAPGDMKRVVLDIMQTHNELSDVERMKEVIHSRLEGLEAADSRDSFAAEQSSLLRSESEEAALIKRLQLLEAELEDQSYRISPRDLLLSTGKLSARTESRSGVQFDPRISPYLTENIRKRLTEGRSLPEKPPINA